MNKKLKNLSLAAVIILGLLFTSWKVFNYYWRTKNTVSTFKNFKEPKTVSYSNIKWVSGSYGDLKTDISSFFVKVKLNGIDDSFYMQFDTGTSQSKLYGKTLNALKLKYPSFEFKKSQSGNYWLESSTLSIGSVSLQADNLLVLSELGSAEIDSSFTVLGTIGYDAIFGRKLLLDFKKNKLAITNHNLKELEYKFNEIKGASVNQFPILFPAEVDGENVQLTYDTGSSMFPLIVDNQKLQNLESAGSIDTLCCITSWGKSYDFYRRKLNTDITVGKLIEEKPYVYSSNSMSPYDFFPNWLMMGLAGNKMFLNEVILIDTENNIFGIGE
ncbi:hypothetical protein QYS49_27440 [Marivirga salinae]|uniref:Uncharacterized protein n=1 Tax=Marivirga salinarum TaxID=3059078 RepID=A0AA49GBJ8_9BACT|nr:hypothetical protein [Marivirga sp. BDSF4-3]WKK75261.2 hypothetical protein QYS49_27440 [Marivirga sp. BDSF4-3]